MSRLEKVKHFFGIEKLTKYTHDFFDASNIRSSLYVASVVVVLELWMICSTLFFQFVGDLNRSDKWLFTHLLCYSVLLISALVLLIYSILHLKKIVKNQNVWWTIRFVFAVISIAFGIYISYLDYLKGEQFITLMTMTIIVFCFTVWRPIYSIIFLTTSYGVFFYLCNSAIPASYATKVNLSIVLIIILLSAINSYRQKLSEAKKDEQLEQAHDILLKLSISDEVTGIANMNYFRGQSFELINKNGIDIHQYIYLYFDIENFKMLNQKYGFWEGNSFLKKFADLLNQTFEKSLTAHFSNDNFVVLTKDERIKEKVLDICKKLSEYQYDIKLGIKVGAYKPENKEVLPLVACDHARYACNSIKKHYNITYCLYDETMSLRFQKKQYIINNFDSAIKNEYIQVYYQPFVNSQTGKICGMEALARWNDPQFGFLSPVDFIETLEEYYQIHRLDMYIVEKVCQHIESARARGRKIIPVSLNFSRLDFDSLNLAEEVENCLKKYNIDKSDIHIEITESTLSEDDIKLQEELKSFRAHGYALWLDDFGSGYSGLNVLKEYDFDLLKIDMKFLSNFEGNERARQILKNVINLAKDIGMQTLTEGVETQEAYDFLRENGCEKLQGYLFSKPISREELEAKLDAGTFVIE
ncbi:diguanylate cyclase (GGDEF) domain-containing protein [Treponema bryantii]|uniref:Diguanylate cyclase (GGDEF) domain-containing protein n=1 Tax=Treponema bryantii TaxID=163 RepID=A0A1H9IMT7_9SPIR|nr:GGDEF domain-containing phosphodiesterase [Treponema bryantii]SEQ75904.1 diguanylate cyclase (GGDEF) domain-containing protein [Treponema bryantii]